MPVLFQTMHSVQVTPFRDQVFITPVLAPETQTRKTEINLFQHTALSNNLFMGNIYPDTYTVGNCLN